jgi:hypothetical protein
MSKIAESEASAIKQRFRAFSLSDREEQMARNAFIAFAQSKLDETRREVKDAVVNFEIPDETILELRKSAKRAADELKDLDRQAAKKGLFGFLGF